MTFIVCLALFALYALFNIAAMLFYPGGTASDPTITGYRFFQNFFSDLGMTTTYGGAPNTVASLLFSSALMLMGIALALFSASVRAFFQRTAFDRVVGWLTAGSGSLACFFCVAVALTPLNLAGGLHLAFVYCFSGMFLLTAAFLAISITCEKGYPRFCLIAILVYVAILVSYLVCLAIGPGMESTTGLAVAVTGQKTSIYRGMICVFIQLIGALRYLASWNGATAQ